MRSLHALVLQTLLATTNGVRGEIKKTRYLYLYEQTRIHVDQVEKLGNFMELEVCLRDEQTLENGTQIAKAIQKQLAISDGQLMTGAYFDSIDAK